MNHFYDAEEDDDLLPEEVVPQVPIDSSLSSIQFMIESIEIWADQSARAHFIPTLQIIGI